MQKTLAQRKAQRWKYAEKARKSPEKNGAKTGKSKQKTIEKSLNFAGEVARWLPLLPLGGLAFLAKFVFTGYSFSALVLCALMGIIIFYNTARLLKGRFPKPVKAVTTVFTVILCIGLLVVGITEALIIRASFGSPGESCEYVVVLGAKVRHDGPSVSLQNRIDGAYDYLTEHPGAIAIVSGGKGGDEPMTEAECMYTELIAMGIDPDRVWMEDKATSTWENLKFTLDLVEQKTGTRPRKLGVVSSEYHLFRASLFAREHGVEFVGIPAETTRISLKINYFLREVAGVWHYILLGGRYE